MLLIEDKIGTAVNKFLQEEPPTQVKLSAVKVRSDAGIVHWGLNKTNCLFPDGYKLKNYKKYSFANCLLECEMDYAKLELHRYGGPAPLV